MTLTTWRRRRQLSARALARLAGLSVGTVLAAERLGARTIRTARAISTATGGAVSVRSLLRAP